MKTLEDICAYEKPYLRIEELEKQVAAQAAQIEMLTVIIERIQKRCSGEAMPNWENTAHTGRSRGLILDWTNYALSITPSQALQDYTDKVLEKAVKLCYEVGSRDTRFEAMDCAEAIKAMKGNPL
mgnify:CR=1 FL=1